MGKLVKPREIRDLAVFDGYNSDMDSVLLAEENRTLKAALAARDGRIEYLEFEMAKLKQLIFGARSERLQTPPDPAQLPLWDEHPEDLQVASLVKFKTVVKSPAKGKAKRTALPEHLPREIVVLPLSAEDRRCPECGEERPIIGYESSERLDYMPAQLIEQGIPLPGLLAYVLMAKFSYHLPLYHLEQVFAHQGVPIARTTLCDWVLQCGFALKPLADRLLVLLKQQAVIFSDDTTVVVQDRGKTRETRFWVYAGHSPPIIVYDHTETRAGKHPKTRLEGYSGYLQADAYAGYDQVFADGRIIEVACWAHARRKFFEIARQTEKGKRISAHEALDFIGQLYGIEQEAKDLELDADGIRRLRQEKTKPILSQFKERLGDHLRELAPKSPTAKAIGYALKNWQALERYTEDGRLEIDNNRSERAIRPLAIGRKNWLFLGSPRGGQAAATVFSLIQTCKELGLNPEAYLKDVLTRLPNTKQKDTDSLLPHNWTPAGASRPGD